MSVFIESGSGSRHFLYGDQDESRFHLSDKFFSKAFVKDFKATGDAPRATEGKLGHNNPISTFQKNM
jgi:hypothetical protein